MESEKKDNEEKEEKEIKEKNSDKKQTLVDKLKENPWKTSTVVLGIILLVFLFSNFSGLTGSTVTGSVDSESEAGELASEFFNTKLSNNPGEIVNIEKISGVYQIVFSVNGEEVPLYFTLDGKWIQQGSDLVPLAISENTQQSIEPDWSIFENELPDNIKSKIISFDSEESEVFDEELRISEFENYDLISKTLIVFYHPGCGWCAKYYPVLVEAQGKYPEITIYALVLSEDRDIAEKYGVTGTPTNIINGKYFVSGYKSIEDLSEILDKLN